MSGTSWHLFSEPRCLWPQRPTPTCVCCAFGGELGPIVIVTRPSLPHVPRVFMLSYLTGLKSALEVQCAHVCVCCACCAVRPLQDPRFSSSELVLAKHDLGFVLLSQPVELPAGFVLPGAVSFRGIRLVGTNVLSQSGLGACSALLYGICASLSVRGPPGFFMEAFSMALLTVLTPCNHPSPFIPCTPHRLHGLQRCPPAPTSCRKSSAMGPCATSRTSSWWVPMRLVLLDCLSRNVAQMLDRCSHPP